MADVILIIGLFLFFIVLPSVIVLREIYLRRKFPIRAKISYEEGGSGTKKKTTLMQDRLGYVDVCRKSRETSRISALTIFARKSCGSD
jgi:hypothetical protein